MLFIPDKICYVIGYKYDIRSFPTLLFRNEIMPHHSPKVITHSYSTRVGRFTLHVAFKANPFLFGEKFFFRKFFENYTSNEAETKLKRFLSPKGAFLSLFKKSQKWSKIVKKLKKTKSWPFLELFSKSIFSRIIRPMKLKPS